MTVVGVGDLATSLLARRMNADLKGQFEQLAQELSTGRKANLANDLRGNTSQITAIEHSLSTLQAYSDAQIRFSQKLNHAEIAMNKISEDISGVAASLLSSVGAGSDTVNAVVSDGSSRFDSVLSALKTRIGENYVFSGTSSTTSPLSGTEDILTALEAATSGLTTAVDFYQSIDDWFSLPGGFDTIGYTGGAAPTNGVGVSPTTDLNFEVTAEASEVRSVLRDLAVVALVERNSFLGNDIERDTLLSNAASGLIQGEDALISVRAELGVLQARAADAQAENASQSDALAIMKNELVSVDLFETASRFEEVQLQLESFYLATSKSARLSLTEYLR